MTAPNVRRLPALTLALALAGWAAGRAEAATMYQYSAIGSVATPAGGVPNLVYFDGLNNASLTIPDGSSVGNINLGRLVVSSLSKTVDQTYKDTGFYITVTSGQGAGALITGALNGSVGPDVTNPSLTATFNSVTTPKGYTGLPFALNLPLGTPMSLSLSDGTAAAPTGLVAPAAIPEPASIAVFAVALGGLGLWRRRAAR